MADVLASLVTEMSVESAQFKREMKKAEAANQRYKKAANDASFANQKLSNAFSKAANTTATLTGPLNSMSGRLSSIASGFARFGPTVVAAGAAIGGLVFVLGKSISAFDELERGMLKTEALVKSTGGSAGKTAEDIESLTRTVALNTLASVEGVRSASQVLLTFKSVTGETFDETIRLSQDLAAVMGTDIKTATLQLGKALEDPETGLNALKRSGVSFTDAQKDMIKSMVDSGNVADAQTAILRTLKEQIGGAGAAEAGGLSGAVDTLSQRWTTLLEVIGDKSGAAYAATEFFTLMASGVHGLKNIISADDNERVFQLRKELSELAEEYNNLSNGKTTKSFGGRFLGADWRKEEMARIVEQQKEAQAELDALVDKGLAKEREREAVKQAAKDAADKRESERLAYKEKQAKEQATKELKIETEKAAAKLKRQQSQDAKYVDSLKKRYAKERELVEINHQEAIAKVQTLQLTEEQIRARGYETLEALQQDYFAKADEKRLLELERIAEANEREVQLEIDKQKRINEAQSREKQAYINTEMRMEQSLTNMKLSVAHQGLDLIAKTAKEGSALQKAAFFSQKALAMATAYLNTELAAISAMAPPPVGLGPVAGLPYAQTIRTLGYTSIGLMAAQTIAGFEGGGYIPDGPRIGGLDGRGGKLAILHPDESIYDHKKGQSVPNSQQPVNITLELPDGTNRDVIDSWYEDNKDRIVHHVQYAMGRI